MEPQEEIGGLLFKIHCGEQLVAGESQVIDDWVSRSEENRHFYKELLDDNNLLKEVQAMLRMDENNSWEVISREIYQHQGKKTPRAKIQKPYLVAASLVILMTTLIYLFLFKTPDKMPRNNPTIATLEPSKSEKKVLLTLSDGKVVELDSIEPGVILEKGNLKIVKTKDQQLVYNSEGADKSKYFFNTLTTYRAMQYSVVLPDSSKVWLSAATSLRYPSTFYGQERRVELIGEAYFEIVNSPQHPFKVIVPSWQFDGPPAEIEVLGTDFDIRAYRDETKLQATVIDGSVKVSKGSSISAIVNSNERLTLDTSSDQPKFDRPDASEVIGWKQNGYIRIEGDIKAIMQQLNKWFDFEVVYTNPIGENRMVGIVSKTRDFSTIMKQLGAEGVHYTLEGKKVTILP